MKKTKKSLTLDEAAERLADIIGGHLAKLPVAERKARLAKAHQRVKAIARASDHVGVRSIPGGRRYTARTRLAARSSR